MNICISVIYSDESRVGLDQGDWTAILENIYLDKKRKDSDTVLDALLMNFLKPKNGFLLPRISFERASFFFRFINWKINSVVRFKDVVEV